MNYSLETLIRHYETYFGNKLTIHRPVDGRIAEMSKDFCVVSGKKNESEVRVYATAGMSSDNEPVPIEIFILQHYSEFVDERLITILSAVAHFHRTATPLAVGHTVNFGIPWQQGSMCTYGLLSLPYLDGPKLERPSNCKAQVLWLIPITAKERQYKMQRSLEDLETQFEVQEFDYLEPLRKSVV